MRQNRVKGLSKLIPLVASLSSLVPPNRPTCSLSPVPPRLHHSVNGQNMCVNNYDVRLTDTHPACGMNWPPDVHDLAPYLSVSSRAWLACFSSLVFLDR